MKPPARRFWLTNFCCALGMFFWPASSLAEPPEAAPACEPLVRELTTARAELQRALEAVRAAGDKSAELESLQTALQRMERERAERDEALGSCKSASEELCAAAGAFTRGLADGRVDVRGLATCVSSEAQKHLADELSGWSNATKALAQLGAFSAGDSDAAPGLHSSSGSRIEKVVGRLFATSNGSPLVYRRLLVEALRLIAPVGLRSLREQPNGVDHWFALAEPLDPTIVLEARRATGSTGAASAPALVTASSLVQSYELVAGCGRTHSPRDCLRAGQLRQLLEASGPLIARRRVEELWTSECSAISAQAISDWLQDVPSTPLQEADAVLDAAKSKLLTCFLRDATGGSSFSKWLAKRLPSSTTALSQRSLDRVVALEHWWQPGSRLDACAGAVRAMQTLDTPDACRASIDWLGSVNAWAYGRAPNLVADSGFDICDHLAQALWRGDAATFPDSFASPPTVADMVRLVDNAPGTAVARLRRLCGERVGAGREFERSIASLAKIGEKLGESSAQAPWTLSSDSLPIERQRARRGTPLGEWLRSNIKSNEGCALLELTGERCQACRELPKGARYDCDLVQQLQDSWSARTRLLLSGLLLTAVIACAAAWALRLRRGLMTHGQWLSQVREYLDTIGIEARPDRFRYLIPSRWGYLRLNLPATHGWERWGRTAVLLRSESGLQERDVNRAGALAKAWSAELALLVHDDSASPDLGAVRSMLEWAARGLGKAVHIMPLSLSRLRWSRNADDLLDLAEEGSLRSNPFELRGRVASSAQFFDRERLVSGLLASAESGRFTVVTGLRRFGKSSLALEVARRLPGPSAYVDLTGFHDELRAAASPADVADSILRFVCLELLESARSRTPGKALQLEVPEGKLDAAALASWWRDFGRELGGPDGGKAPPTLVIFDELEHAIGAAREINHAIEAFAILVGRLRNTLHGVRDLRGQRVGIIFCSALHPLLWSPLSTLAHQSLAGSFEQVSVPCLPEETAAAMMRGLGSRQGVRFTEPALELLVTESQSVPLLLRRLGSAVLELYDPERARQGTLGAVEIGVEGVRAAIERELSQGSPLRVWIEAEIAAAESPGGVVLRALAQREHASAVALRSLASDAFRTEFERTGLALELTPGEAQRRAEEAAAVVVRTLGDSGLLRAHGDPTEPEAYALPDGLIRRVLRCEPPTQKGRV